jgi:LAO/AO transport system kinase
MIETVGVGQSEYEVSHLCDIMALLVAPSGGDELQAIKKGIVEMANIIIVTKSDGELVKHARKMAAEITSATKFVNFGEKPIVKRCSALTHEGIDDIWLSIQKLIESEEKKLNKRKEQKVKLLRIALINEIFDLLNENISFKQYEQLLKSNENLLVEDVIQHIIYDDLYRAISNSETKFRDQFKDQFKDHIH